MAKAMMAPKIRPFCPNSDPISMISPPRPASSTKVLMVFLLIAPFATSRARLQFPNLYPYLYVNVNFARGPEDAVPSSPAVATHGDRYKWTALSNTTLGMFMATLDSSIVIISLPAIFRGIHLDPLEPSNVGYLLWMLMGYLVVTAVLVVTFGRIGDILGRVRMYNLGFAVFTVASIGLSLTPGHGAAAAMFLIIVRVIQGTGGALLMANSTAILTDAFPV